ncbi:MAG: AprI/Inh family metalloprotease inhibitor [Caulobacter sp.]|jgi:hypothetical protein|nr:AprI/Inh family metalloprotease inhibitor [Caulobacter sp.]
MRIRTLTLAALAAALAFPAAALALEAPKDYAGRWWISGLGEGDDSCTVTLTDEGAIGGWAIKVPRDCFQKFGFSEDVAAWTVYPDGAIGFIDPLRKPLMKFEPAEIGGYVASPGEGEPLSLDRVTDAKAPTEQERMSGRWALMSFGETLCAWDSTAAKDGLKGALKVALPCQPAWASRTIVRWERAKGRLMLIDSAGKVVRSLPGDSIEGFFSPRDVEENIGFVRDWGN